MGDTKRAMFKKPFKVASHNPMSSKNRKKFKKDLYKAFDGSVIDQIFINSGEFSETKLSGCKVTIFSNDDAPMIIDPTGNRDYFPSIYAVDMYPDLVKCLTLKEGVEKFVMNGANLMWPGVDNLQELDGILLDDVVGIRKSDGTLIAIGALATSLNDAKEMEVPEGVAVYILHIEGDQLWCAGSKTHMKPKFDKEEEEEFIEKVQKKANRKAKKAAKKKKKEESEDDEELDMMMGLLGNKKKKNLDIKEELELQSLLTKQQHGGGGKKKGGKGKKKGGNKQMVDMEMDVGDNNIKEDMED